MNHICLKLTALILGGLKIMSEKRFERWNDNSCKAKDNQEGILLNWEDVANKLNKQQDTISRLEEENERLKQILENLIRR